MLIIRCTVSISENTGCNFPLLTWAKYLQLMPEWSGIHWFLKCCLCHKQPVLHKKKWEVWLSYKPLTKVYLIVYHQRVEQSQETMMDFKKQPPWKTKAPLEKGKMSGSPETPSVPVAILQVHWFWPENGWSHHVGTCGPQIYLESLVMLHSPS